MTCKDCIYYSGCSGILNDFGMRLNPAREVCDRFKDRFRFVELPCKVGDTVYRICPVRKGEGCNCCPWEYCECHDIGFQNDKQNSIREGQANNFAWILKRLPYFGKIYFITRKAAEQALKEREANANDLPQSDNHS